MTDARLDINIHQENKRECFDGMRAYHQSEIAHKKDAIDILKSILTTTVVIYGGLIGASVSEKFSDDILLYSSIVIFIVTCIAVSVITYFTNNKINKDNARYRKYKDEYIKEREILNLESELVDRGYTSAWIGNHNAEKTGFFHTKNILTAFSGLILTVSLVGAAFSIGAVNYKSKEIDDIKDARADILLISESINKLWDELNKLRKESSKESSMILREIDINISEVNDHLDRHLSIYSKKLNENKDN